MPSSTQPKSANSLGKSKEAEARHSALSVTADSCSSVYPAYLCVCVCRGVYAMHAI